MIVHRFVGRPVLAFLERVDNNVNNYVLRMIGNPGDSSSFPEKTSFLLSRTDLWIGVLMTVLMIIKIMIS